MRILVTGSREFDNEQVIRYALGQFTQLHGHAHTVIHGAARRGADRIADRVARGWGGGMTVELHAADWGLYGKAAGSIRNQEMVDAGANVCLAFYKKGAGNRGTADCVRRAKLAGIPVREFWA